MYMTFQYLTVSCVYLATGHVHDISIPDSFMCIPAIGHVHDISIPDSFMCIPASGHVL